MSHKVIQESSWLCHIVQHPQAWSRAWQRVSKHSTKFWTPQKDVVTHWKHLHAFFQEGMSPGLNFRPYIPTRQRVSLRAERNTWQRPQSGQCLGPRRERHPQEGKWSLNAMSAACFHHSTKESSLENQLAFRALWLSHPVAAALIHPIPNLSCFKVS